MITQVRRCCIIEPGAGLSRHPVHNENPSKSSVLKCESTARMNIRMHRDGCSSLLGIPERRFARLPRFLPRKESGTGKILTGATFHGRIASVTGARYDRRISRGRSYIRRTYAERKFPGPRRRYLIAAAVCKAPIETIPRHYARLKNLRGFFRPRVGLPVNGRQRPTNGAPRSLEGHEIEFADKSSRGGKVRGDR